MAWKTSARIKAPKRTKRHLWVGFKPYGLGETKPNHYKEVVKTFWDNRDNLPYAWRILRKGVCDGCALGVAGFHDWTISGVHLCTTRLNLLRVNTMGALDPSVLADVAPLRRLRGKELRDLGRLAHPMVRRRGERGFTQVTWDEALDLVAGRLRATAPDRFALYLTARGITNETYYVAQKVTRFLGSNNIDNAARVCHAPSTTTLKKTIGVAATTCSYTDVIDSDLIVLFGANVANGQPVFMKYLFLARKRGAKVVVVNPLREPGLDRYWVPSNVESAMFGTKMADEFFAVHTGGDVAFLNGVLKVMLAEGTDRSRLRPRAHDRIRRPARGARARVVRRPRTTVGRDPSRHGAIRRYVRRGRVGGARVVDGHHAARAGCRQRRRDRRTSRWRAATWGARVPGSCPSAGTPACRAVPRWAPTPPRFPGGVAIDADTAAALAAAVRLPDRRPRRHDRRGDGRSGWPRRARRPLLVRRQLPRGPARSRPRSRTRSPRVPLRVHQDIVVSSQMLVDPGEVVVLLPAATRYEQRDGGTETTTERRIVFSPEIAGPRTGEARGEWEIFVDARAAGRIPTARTCSAFDSGQAIRDEIARVVPAVRGSRAALPRLATRSSGAASGCARAARSRRPTARPSSSRSRRTDRRRTRGQLRAQHPPRQAVQHDGARRS